MATSAVGSSSGTANSNLPIYNLINNGTTSSTASSTSTSSSASDASITSQLGPSAFLKLLTTQLSNQDPLNPMDDTQSVSQLAQFSALQASDNLQSSFAAFQSNFAVLQSAQLIGKTVTVNTGSSTTSGSSTVSGTVSAVTVTNGTPSFTMTNSSGSTITDTNGNPLTFTTSQIVGIG
jgi:flagellar basal-body rod modification protein FlgD